MVARVKFSMAGRVIRYQRSDIRRRANSGRRSAIRRQKKAYAEFTEVTEFAEKSRGEEKRVWDVPAKEQRDSSLRRLRSE